MISFGARTRLGLWCARPDTFESQLGHFPLDQRGWQCLQARGGEHLWVAVHADDERTPLDQSVGAEAGTAISVQRTLTGLLVGQLKDRAPLGDVQMQARGGSWTRNDAIADTAEQSRFELLRPTVGRPQPDTTGNGPLSADADGGGHDGPVLLDA